MRAEDDNIQLKSDVLVHLYHSAVVGALDGIAMVLRMSPQSQLRNPRHNDLRELYDALGSDRRDLFYNAVTSIAEFAVYGALYFVEGYNRFESETNQNAYPRLSLVFERAVGEDVIRQDISNYGSDELGRLFKRIARSDQMRSLVEAKIKSILDAGPSKPTIMSGE